MKNLKVSVFVTDPSMGNEQRKNMEKEFVDFIINMDLPSFSNLNRTVLGLFNDSLESSDPNYYDLKINYAIKEFNDDAQVSINEKYGCYSKFLKYQIDFA